MLKKNKLVTAREAKFLDIELRDKFSISVLVLMENAGRALAEEVLRNSKNKKIAIFCGKGNNGGDGFVCARHLLTRGIKPDIYLVGNFSGVQNEAKDNLEILRRLKVKIIEMDNDILSIIKRKIAGCDLIVDALLGVGLSGEVRGIYKDLIDVINSSGVKVLAVDIPSGLDATSGKVLGSCVRADKTVTFIRKKRGMVLGRGPEYCGKIVVKDLGILV